MHEMEGTNMKKIVSLVLMLLLALTALSAAFAEGTVVEESWLTLPSWNKDGESLSRPFLYRPGG